MEKLHRAICEYCDANRITGSLRITRGETVLYREDFGFACRETGERFTPLSRFTYYSMSKPFCAFGFLKLADAGLVSLDEHPGRVIPQLRGLYPAVTFRHMLHHVSGLPDFAKDEILPMTEAAADGDALRAQLPLLKDIPLAFEPGTQGNYCNMNFNLPALAIENLTGMKYSEYLKKEVLLPLGMTHTLVDRPGLAVPHRVQGYLLQGGKVTPTPRRTSWMLGAGDLVGTLEDAGALRRAVKEKLLLKPETWEQVLTPSPLNQMGMGCKVRRWHGKLEVRHNGGSTGFRTLHMFLPEDDTDILFFSNSGWGDARKDITELIHTHLYGSDGTEDSTPMDTGYLN
ncbi:MAG: beta-lactamase family protein [Clostridia bacterium]|nr:beta-lactamase family protein [Clostridia bacterium]